MLTFHFFTIRWPQCLLMVTCWIPIVIHILYFSVQFLEHLYCRKCAVCFVKIYTVLWQVNDKQWSVWISVIGLTSVGAWCVFMLVLYICVVHAVQEFGWTESVVVDRNIVEVASIFQRSLRLTRYWLPTLQVSHHHSHVVWCFETVMFKNFCIKSES